MDFRPGTGKQKVESYTHTPTKKVALMYRVGCNLSKVTSLPAIRGFPMDKNSSIFYYSLIRSISFLVVIQKLK